MTDSDRMKLRSAAVNLDTAAGKIFDALAFTESVGGHELQTQELKKLLKGVQEQQHQLRKLVKTAQNEVDAENIGESG